MYFCLRFNLPPCSSTFPLFLNLWVYTSISCYSTLSSKILTLSISEENGNSRLGLVQAPDYLLPLWYATVFSHSKVSWRKATYLFESWLRKLQPPPLTWSVWRKSSSWLQRDMKTVIVAEGWRCCWSLLLWCTCTANEPSCHFLLRPLLDAQSQMRYSASVNIVDREYISVLVFQHAFSFSGQHAKIKVYLYMYVG